MEGGESSVALDVHGSNTSSATERSGGLVVDTFGGGGGRANVRNDNIIIGKIKSSSVSQFVPGDHYPTPPVFFVHIASTQPSPTSECRAGMENSMIVKDYRSSWLQTKLILELPLPHGLQEGLNSLINVSNGPAGFHPMQGLHCPCTDW